MLLGLLLYRGYGGGVGMRPTETASVRFDLNRAERSDLEQIPGVGPKLAQAIVDHRAEKGTFRTLDQLREVKGFGPATFDKVRPFLRVDPAPPEVPDWDPVPVLERKKPAEVRASYATRKMQPGDPPIDVNTATIERLMTLPDIGPITAQAIVDARPFRSMSDLDRVKGIGPKKLDKLKPFVKVE